MFLTIYEDWTMSIRNMELELTLLWGLREAT